MPQLTADLRSVATATQVLDCFLAEDELGPSQVARQLGVAKSTAYHVLASLAAGGLLDRTPGGRYRLSLRLFDYGQLVLERLPLRQIARPVLVQLHQQVTEMVQLGLPAAGHVVYVERIGNGGLGPYVSGEVMRRVAGYASSAGRAMAAFDETIAGAQARVRRVRHTPFTIVDPTRLARILDRTRTSGWVRSVDESAQGYTSVAAPVFTPASSGATVAGAISLVGGSARITGPRQDFYVASVRAAAREVSDRLARFTAA